MSTETDTPDMPADRTDWKAVARKHEDQAKSYRAQAEAVRGKIAVQEVANADLVERLSGLESADAAPAVLEPEPVIESAPIIDSQGLMPGRITQNSGAALARQLFGGR